MVSSYELESRLFTLWCAWKSRNFSEHYDLIVSEVPWNNISSSQDMVEGYPEDKDRSLIILLDIGIGLVEQLLLMVELVF